MELSLWGKRRRKARREFEFLIVPQGHGGVTKSIKASVGKLVALGIATSMILFLVFLLVFRFTPAGKLAGINPDAQAAWRKEANETRQRVQSLAEEVEVLKEYNLQLRKALGAHVGGDTAAVRESGQDARQQTRVAQERDASEDVGAGLPQANVAAAQFEGLKSSFPLFVPVEGVVTQGFEPNQKHLGIDYAAKGGAPVHAAAAGYVLFAGWTYDDGNVVILSHGGGYITVYKHNSALLKPVGSFVRRGELIGLVGNTGRTSKGPHLHFEVLKDGVPQDPMQFLLTAAKT